MDSPNLPRIFHILAVLSLVASCDSGVETTTPKTIVRDISPGQWDHYGGNLSGTRYVAESAITPSNVDGLEPAWMYRTGDAIKAIHGKVSNFKATPILFAGNLVFSTGLNKVHALDPFSGELAWVFDPELDLDVEYSEQFTSRGVSAWSDPQAAHDDSCADRIYLGTLDSRLFSLDASNGKKCTDFGDDGAIDLSSGANLGPLDWRFRRGEYAVTSPPLIANGVVVVGSSVGDNGKTNLESGVVRGFDARTGEELWRWDPIPRDESRTERSSWESESWQETGAANVWTAMAADPELNLVYLPTTSPSPDFYGGERLGDNRYANSVVALDLTTGQPKWAYQAIKHDLWDYDLAAQPMLVDAVIAGESKSLLVQAGKNGFIYFLDRTNGKPVFEVIERAVPQTTVPGEQTSKTQGFSALRLHPEPQDIPPIFNASKDHVEVCERMLADVEFEGIFTPPSLDGTLLYPGNPGGVNWGSMAASEPGSLGFVVVNRWPTVVQLLPRETYNELESSGISRGVPAAYTEQEGTPYGMVRFDAYNSDEFSPCFEGPWSTLVAIDLKTGTKKWEVPAGMLPKYADHPKAANWGSPINQGGPIATSSGVVFLATRYDAKIHAFEAQSGSLLWSESLPAQPQATPMAYSINGTSYVVIAAGGWDQSNDSERGDYVVAFKLNRSE
ncbi:MAG: PQQ-binding-like beta-propeller repeat protein [Pseudomonadales bacterium]|nr:PQQ-binding-like beta-propeller repeat protein [Pseudomonadales bacterium]